MGTICVILAVLITVFVLMFGQFNDMNLNLALMYTDIKFSMSYLVSTLIVFALGIFTGVILMLSQFFDAAGRYTKLKKQYDKNSLNTDEADEKIRLLENKVKTLEAALNKAMGK